MIALLIALGIVGDVPAQTSTIIAPAEQTVVLTRVQAANTPGAGIPIGAFEWQKAFDPSDRAPYAFDFAAELPTGAKIASIERLTMLAAGAAVGVQIDQTDSRRPIIGADDDATKIQLWFLVDDADQANGAFSGAGIKVGVAALVRTDNDPYQQFERTAVLTVRQR